VFDDADGIGGGGAGGSVQWIADDGKVLTVM